MNEADARRRQAMERIAQGLADQGMLIEAGWVMFRLVAMPGEAQSRVLDSHKEAFFSGAQHLFGSIMSLLEPGDDETPADIARMDNIHAELERFGEQLRLKYGRTAGSA